MEEQNVKTYSRLGTWTCRECGTRNITNRPDLKVCSKCRLNHDGPTYEEKSQETEIETLAAKEDISVGEEKAKVNRKKRA